MKMPTEEQWNALRFHAMTHYTVSGTIINDWNGPRCYCLLEVEASTPYEAGQKAIAAVASQQSDGRHGVLWVSNIFQLVFDENGIPWPQQVDKYATYADDPDRPEGVAPSGGYFPPRGYEGED